MVHTPGEWRVEGATIVSDELAQWSGRETEVADLNGCMSGDDTISDLHLMAAAGVLLEAAQEAEKHFGPFADITINGQHDADDVRVVALLRAAIARATRTPEAGK